MVNRSRILEIRPETRESVSLLFEKPANFTYKAGQFCNIEAPIQTVPPPNNKKNFSLSSSPGQPHLSITFRRGMSPFKQFLENLKVSDFLTFTGPFGKFVLNEDPSLTAVFLTGGIGITPFHAMIKDATDRNLNKKIILIYSNKSPEDIPFKEELNRLDEINTHLTIYHTITTAENLPVGFSWAGKRGRIDAALIREVVPEIAKSEFYIVGAVAMVLSLKALLIEMKIDPGSIHFELFTGYA